MLQKSYGYCQFLNWRHQNKKIFVARISNAWIKWILKQLFVQRTETFGLRICSVLYFILFTIFLIVVFIYFTVFYISQCNCYIILLTTEFLFIVYEIFERYHGHV